MERKFDEAFKKDFMAMKVGEDWNKLKENYNVSEYEWDNEMKIYFDKLLEEYSKDEDYRKVK